jgi:uncharacterized membrane protein YeaQ/YmgE (transglycosylase-associated protein family)
MALGRKPMTAETLLIFLVVGAIAGWLAGLIVSGGGFGLIGDIVVGVVGAFIAGWLLPQLGIHLMPGFVGEIIDATIGAVILLLVIRLIRRR